MPTNRSKGNSSAEDSPSKEPLMSPAKGLGRGKKGIPKAESVEMSPGHHAKENNYYQSSTSPVLSSSRYDSGTAAAQQEENVVPSETDHLCANMMGNKNPTSPGSLRRALLANGIHMQQVKQQVDQVDGNDKAVPPLPQAKYCAQEQIVQVQNVPQLTQSQRLAEFFKLPSRDGGKSGSGGGGKKKGSKKNCLKTSVSDTVLVQQQQSAQGNNKKHGGGGTKGVQSTTSLQPFTVEEDPALQDYYPTTGTVKSKLDTGDRMRADMVDLSERYSNPTNVLSLGILGVVVGLVSLSISFITPGLRLWTYVGCAALLVGFILLGVGGCWYYAKSRLIIVGEGDVEIKVVNGEVVKNQEGDLGKAKVTGV